ncbi:Sec-independent protein translocase subunit TatA [Kitasatospora sp. NPDC059795]|uniref:Sec-independent protein translocase subunit TatA n=1 Tax=unclassified Kitasatospora TaxID=2633591 RepID=UPI00093CAAE7|nr:Sec-independent protein translocase subunit TatA [Kitasatospora sp. CB01950]OKJ16957.1 preprotein translocase subunit TatA [Kitasatospora sp. CB01950]
MFRNGLEPWHILIMVVVLVLLFGSKKLPEMARGLGKSMRILKAETKALREEDAPAAEAQNGTAASQAAEQPRQAVEPTVITKAAETSKSTTA